MPQGDQGSKVERASHRSERLSPKYAARNKKLGKGGLKEMAETTASSSTGLGEHLSPASPPGKLKSQDAG